MINELREERERNSNQGMTGAFCWVMESKEVWIFFFCE